MGGDIDAGGCVRVSEGCTLFIISPVDLHEVKLNEHSSIVNKQMTINLFNLKTLMAIYCNYRARFLIIEGIGSFCFDRVSSTNQFEERFSAAELGTSSSSRK